MLPQEYIYPVIKFFFFFFFLVEQFRMHSSTRVDVFLSVSSNPIIETCSQIRFSQYPNNFLIPNPEGVRTIPFLFHFFVVEMDQSIVAHPILRPRLFSYSLNKISEFLDDE